MQRRSEDTAAIVNGLVVLLVPVIAFVVLGLVIEQNRVTNTSTFVSAGERAIPDLMPIVARMLWWLSPFALLAGWRTRVHARRRLEHNDRGWNGVMEAALTGFGVALLYFAPGILTRPREAPPYIIFYGGIAFGLGLLVGVILRFTAILALRWQRTAAAILLIALGAGVATPTAQERMAVAPEFLLQAGRAGVLEIGEPVDDIYKEFGRDRIRLIPLFSEGHFYPALEVRLFESDRIPAALVDISEWPCPTISARSITVFDRRYRTVDGLGVGSTLGNLRKRYPNVGVGWGEGDLVAVVEEAGLTFILESRQSQEPPTDGTVVTGVLVFAGDPDAIRRKRCPDRVP